MSTKSGKAAFIAALMAAPKRTVQIKDKLHVHIGEDKDGSLDRAIKRALVDGQTVTEDGKATWVEERPVYDTSKTGSEAYTWRGDKVLVDLMLKTKDLRTGTLEIRSVGQAWRNP